MPAHCNTTGQSHQTSGPVRRAAGYGQPQPGPPQAAPQQQPSFFTPSAPPPQAQQAPPQAPPVYAAQHQPQVKRCCNDWKSHSKPIVTRGGAILNC